MQNAALMIKNLDSLTCIINRPIIKTPVSILQKNYKYTAVTTYQQLQKLLKSVFGGVTM